VGEGPGFRLEACGVGAEARRRLTARGTRLGETGEEGSTGRDLRFLGGSVGGLDRGLDLDEGKKGGKTGRVALGKVLRATRVVTVTADAVDAPVFAVLEAEKKARSEDVDEQSIAVRCVRCPHRLFPAWLCLSKYMYTNRRH
jgi:hypothetical protein